jgi:nucleoside-diphosphate-sugar epimerase
MRFHTAVNKFCWQAVMGQPITVWRTALRQKRPYLALDDAVRAISFIIGEGLFDRRIYNVLTENLTVEQIIGYIGEHAPDHRIEYVDTEIMNQLSYEGSCRRVREKGFEVRGSIRRCVAETIARIRKASGAATEVGTRDVSGE